MIYDNPWDITPFAFIPHLQPGLPIPALTISAMKDEHLHDQLAKNPHRVTVNTAFGDVIGGRASNGCAVFLEIPYALPPRRFEDPRPLPEDYRYASKEYIREASYCAQPLNDGQTADMPFEDKVGFGEPTENPLYLNVVVPPSFPEKKKFPVKVYIHGGFLQFGSPHGLSSQAQYIAAERSELWVNIGYRLSVFGFIGSENPPLPGNYGFKDQWLALEWIKSNIEAFGGDSSDIQISGLSAGSHSVHQLLHKVSVLPPGVMSPFQSAALQSNAILINPKTPAELQPQFDALCRSLGLDPSAGNILDVLRDTERLPWSELTRVIENEEILGQYGTFRGALSKDWIDNDVGLMEWQSSGGFARGLLEHGVKSIIIGEVTEEWYLYSIAHPINTLDDVLPNMQRYYPDSVARRMFDAYPHPPEGQDPKEYIRLYGEIMCMGQVYLPARLFAEQLLAHGFPVLRYSIGWSPEKYRPHGYVTHGCDRLIWALRQPLLTDEESATAKDWLVMISQLTAEMNSTGKAPDSDPRRILSLYSIGGMGWITDPVWDDVMALKDKFLQSS